MNEKLIHGEKKYVMYSTVEKHNMATCLMFFLQIFNSNI